MLAHVLLIVLLNQQKCTHAVGKRWRKTKWQPRINVNIINFGGTCKDQITLEAMWLEL